MHVPNRRSRPKGSRATRSAPPNSTLQSDDRVGRFAPTAEVIRSPRGRGHNRRTGARVPNDLRLRAHGPRRAHVPRRCRRGPLPVCASAAPAARDFRADVVGAWDASRARHAAELAPVLAAARSGAAVDAQILGERRVRSARYFSELVRPHGGRETLCAVPVWRGEPVGCLWLGRCGTRGRFRDGTRAASTACSPRLPWPPSLSPPEPARTAATLTPREVESSRSFDSGSEAANRRAAGHVAEHSPQSNLAADGAARGRDTRRASPPVPPTTPDDADAPLNAAGGRGEMGAMRPETAFQSANCCRCRSGSSGSSCREAAPPDIWPAPDGHGWCSPAPT